jgi:DNA-binding response OmpR family regulator
MFMRVLVVEDEQKMADLIKRGLEKEGMKVDLVSDGRTGLEAGKSGKHELIVLDMGLDSGLPGRDGLEIARELRNSDVRVPVLVLTTNESPEMKVRGREIGVNDYLTKPFDFSELMTRVRTLHRLANQNGHSGQSIKERNSLMQIGDLVLNLSNRRASRAGIEVQLTGKESELLKCLMSYPDQTLTRDILSEQVWDGNFDQLTNVIDVYINYLRNKIDRNFEPKLIETVRGRRGDGESNRLRGYKFVTPLTESRLVVAIAAESKAS